MRKLQSVLLLSALASAASAGHAEQFVARFNFRESNLDATGRIAVAVDNTAVEIEECADSVVPAADPKTLELIYDTAADEIQVVSRSSGENVCTVFQFSGGTTVTSADGKKQVRHAFLSVPDHPGSPIGSIAGAIARKYDDQGNLIGYSWVARFQASISEDIEVIEGRLFTLRLFVPGER